MPKNYPTPSHEAFQAMESSTTLQISNEVTGNIHTFNIGDHVVVISESDDEWHARLLDIRLQTDTEEDWEDDQVVWLQVQWFHNREHVEQQGFAKHMGELELVLSQDIDLVEATCLERKEKIVRFDDSAPSGPAIQPNDRYMRWCMNVKGMKVMKVGRTKKRMVVYELQGLVIGCPSCDKPYNPDKDEQRFCRGCKHWYHLACIDMLPPSLSGVPTLVEEQTHMDSGELDADLQSILRIPIERGGIHGIVGNGKDLLAAWRIFEEIRVVGKGLTTQRAHISRAPLACAKKHYCYFYCMTCSKEGRDSFM